jgi:hypothetical protein
MCGTAQCVMAAPGHFVPGVSRPPTPCLAARKTWVPGTRLVPGPAIGPTRVPGVTTAGLCVNPTEQPHDGQTVREPH